MKKIFLQYVSVALAVGALTLPARSQSQGSPYTGSVRMDSCSIREDNDSIKVNFRMHVDRQSAAWFAGMLLTPALTNGDPTIQGTKIVPLPDVMVQGSNKHRMTERSIRLLGKEGREAFKRPATTIRVKDGTDTVIRYNYSASYEMWMDSARLSVYEEIINFRNERQLVVLSTGGNVKLETRIPYEVKPQVNFITPAPEAKVRSRQGSAFLDFQVGKSVILPTFRRNPVELGKIRDAFTEIENDNTAQIQGLFIEGFASPEGRYDTNARLASERANALKNYIVANFRVPLRDDQIKVNSTAEDWDGLRTLIVQSNMPNKDEVLAIIDNTPDPDQREAKLRVLARGVPYKIMLTDMFPQLRRVEYQIDFTVKDFTVDESRTLVWTRPEVMSQLELFNTAQSYGPGTKEYDRIMLEIIPKYYPNDPVAAVNTAAVMIRNGELVSARRLLDRHSDNEITANNFGVIYLMDGDLDKAEPLFKWAAAAGVPEAKANLLELNKKREDNVRMERYRNR